MLFLYRLSIYLLVIFLPIIITYRIFKGKEDPKRFIEKFGFFTKKRKKGNLIWFHGSSVGEILSVLPLIENLEKDKKVDQILLTTNTLSSSKVLNKFKFKKTIHQFFPLDINIIINKFLKYWNPKSVFFIESEIWPNMILKIKSKKTPLILINARITKKSFNRWNKINYFSKRIFEKFNLCLCQNSETLNYLKKLGSKNNSKPGNLKFAEIDFVTNNEMKKSNKYFFKNKKILFGGISTHATEEDFCARLHVELMKKFKNGLSIIVPRHVDRRNEILEVLDKYNLNVHVHSQKGPINKNTNIYLVDTFGETRIFLKYCRVVFLGGSLVNHGGQNPLEAARLGCKVIHGSSISNFEEVYNLLKNYNITFKIKNEAQAAQLINIALKKKISKNLNMKRLNFLGKKILSKNYSAIRKYI